MNGYTHQCAECGAGIVWTENGGWIHYGTKSWRCYPHLFARPVEG